MSNNFLMYCFLLYSTLVVPVPNLSLLCKVHKEMVMSGPAVLSSSCRQEQSVPEKWKKR